MSNRTHLCRNMVTCVNHLIRDVMSGSTLYICMTLLITSILGAASTDELIYVRSHQGKDASKFVLKSETVSNVVDCVLVCDLNDNTLSLQYNRATGLCVCHSVSPQSLDLEEETNSDIYYSPERMDLVPSACTETDGFIYDREAHFCFKIHSDRKRWVVAQAQCVSEGGFLAKLDTEKKRNIVNTFVKEDGTVDYYIGGTDAAEDGVWRWVADDSIIPDMTMEGRKECLEIKYDDQALDDSKCNWSTNKYVCEISV